MDNKILELCEILSDNNYVAKYKEIPDEFDHADELKAQIERDGFIPDSMRYFELNGFSSPVDFEELLSKHFESFKIAFISEIGQNKEKLTFEIHRQLTVTKKHLLDLLEAIKPYGDITFDSLVKNKLHYCTETLNFILFEHGHVSDQEHTKIEENSPIYFFRIHDNVKPLSAHLISQLHKELKKSGYIDCPLRDFRRLFINPNEAIPSQTPQPIIWKRSEYNHLAYFIKCLTGTLLTSQKNPSNYEIAINLFYDSKGENPFSSKKLRFDGRLSSGPKKTFDTIMKHLGLDESKRIPHN